MAGKENIGLFRYYTFGWREQWVYDFFRKGPIFFENNALGPKQLLAFYLKDIEILKGNELDLHIFDILFSILDKNSYLVWCIIWCNLTYNSPLFRWWTNLPKGIYRKNELDLLLGKFYGKFDRSVKDACNSLVGTFERTPIGKDLSQGIVQKEGRQRIIIKEGDPDLSPIAVLYNLYKFAERSNLYEFSIFEIENKPLSPQKVFCTTSNKIENLVLPYAYQNIISLNTESESLKIKLRTDLNSIDILRKYVGGEIK